MRKLILVIVYFLSVSVYALETEITVLGVTLPGANINQANTYLNSLISYWPTSTGTTVKLANGGVTIPIASTPSGSADVQLSAAKTAEQNLGLRNLYQADVILFFTTIVPAPIPNRIACGYAPQYNWTAAGAKKFVPDANGIDRAGSELWYAGLIATTETACNPYPETAAHEFGHLFAAGHLKPPANIYLFPDSHAMHISIGYPVYANYRTIMAGGPQGATLTGNFSSVSGAWDNLNTLNTTALSVANYRTGSSSGGGGGGGGGGECTLQAPTVIAGSLVNQCLPQLNTEHSVTWLDACPSASTKYEVWYSQPDGADDVKGWETTSASTPVFVIGADSRIRIKSCNNVQCSSLSAMSYLAYYDC